MDAAAELLLKALPAGHEGVDARVVPHAGGFWVVARADGQVLSARLPDDYEKIPIVERLELVSWTIGGLVEHMRG